MKQLERSAHAPGQHRVLARHYGERQKSHVQQSAEGTKEWKGFVAREISNTTPLPAKVEANEGLCRILFFRSGQAGAISHADCEGKFQKLQGIVLPKL